jgi:hypothetical protein
MDVRPVPAIEVVVRQIAARLRNQA